MDLLGRQRITGEIGVPNRIRIIECDPSEFESYRSIENGDPGFWLCIIHYGRQWQEHLLRISSISEIKDQYVKADLLGRMKEIKSVRPSIKDELLQKRLYKVKCFGTFYSRDLFVFFENPLLEEYTTVLDVLVEHPKITSFRHFCTIYPDKGGSAAFLRLLIKAPLLSLYPLLFDLTRIRRRVKAAFLGFLLLSILPEGAPVVEVVSSSLDADAIQNLRM